MFKPNDLPVLAILRGIERRHLEPLIAIFKRAGIPAMEITMNTPGATGLITHARQLAPADMSIGAGTVLSVEDLESALKAGAGFIVTPSVSLPVIEGCRAAGIPFFPGALTPTEVHQAWENGATLVKLFPAGVFGPSYIRMLKGPFDSLKIIAVGGVNEENAGEFLRQGADALAFGAGIVKTGWLKEERYDLIEEKLNQLLSGLS